jgi:glycerol-3-phosphate dehydrogenase
MADHLIHLYGAEAVRLLGYAEADTGALDPIDPGGPDVWAQAFLAVEKEWALTVDDISSRRTTLAPRGLVGDAVRPKLEAIVPQQVDIAADARNSTLEHSAPANALASGSRSPRKTAVSY